MTWYDIVFGSIRMAFDKDETIYEFFIRILLSMAINFTWGVIISIFNFLYSAGVLVYSYSTGPIGILFYCLALTGGLSFLSTYLYGIFLAARGVINISLDIME